ncbi:MAG: hypothetical protein M3Y25_07025 [Thermoproteota archaeon]|nr:hypothetical protein [Thermoproteota archaeon]
MLVISSTNLFKEKREITIQRERYELEENKMTTHLVDNLNKQLSKTYILYVIYQKNSLVSVL